MCRNLGDDIWQRMCGGDVMMGVAWYPGKPAWGREDDDVRREQREEGEELGDEMNDMVTYAFDVAASCRVQFGSCGVAR